MRAGADISRPWTTSVAHLRSFGGGANGRQQALATQLLGGAGMQEYSRTRTTQYHTYCFVIPISLCVLSRKYAPHLTGTDFIHILKIRL